MNRLLLIPLFLAGCVTTSQYAVYRHPSTGDVLECERPPAGGGAGIYGLGDAPKIGRYNECKDKVEAMGYERIGTEEREPTAKTATEQVMPRAR